MLHLIQKSPFQSQCLNECLNIAKSQDTFLLMQDGAYALQKTDFLKQFKNVFVLESDLKARGLSTENLDSVKAIGYDKFVELSTQHNKVLSWY